MKQSIFLAVMTMAALTGAGAWAGASPGGPAEDKTIRIIKPPEQGFFSKELSFHGILIKSHLVVSNEALIAAYDRIARETEHLPMVISNLAAAGAELHIIGRNQVTTDLPEWQHDKHVPLDEYNGLTRDERTRGMGGLITSCGEENVLNLPNDRYRGSDICMHEFAHNIEGSGIQRSLRARFDEQYQKSREKGLWLGSYAGSNPSEYFAELTMWYFGSHGSLSGLQGERPGPGQEGLKKYDPDAFVLFDDFYSGRIPVEKLEPRFRRQSGVAGGPSRSGATNASASVPAVGGQVTARSPRDLSTSQYLAMPVATNRPGGGTNSFGRTRTPRDSLQARAIVGHLYSYKVGKTKLSEFLADAGMPAPDNNGTNGWYVTRREAAGPAGDTMKAGYKFRVEFHGTGGRGQPPGHGAGSTGTNSVATNAVATNAANGQGRQGGGGNGRGGGGRSRGSIADLDFKNGLLTAFKWNN